VVTFIWNSLPSTYKNFSFGQISIIDINIQ
jgi:hypothetical protein